MQNAWCRKCWAALFFSFLAVSALAQAPLAHDAVLAEERAFWTAYATGNVTDLAPLLHPEFTNVEQTIWSREQVLQFVRQFHQNCSLAPVVLVDPRVSFPVSDVAMVVYHATETATCGARTLSGDTNISTVWIRTAGRWQMYLHTEYAVPEK